MRIATLCRHEIPPKASPSQIITPATNVKAASNPAPFTPKRGSAAEDVCDGLADEPTTLALGVADTEAFFAFPWNCWRVLLAVGFTAKTIPC